MGRIDNAVLAISVITLAEARFGYLNAEWGERRITNEERRLASFLQIPLDFPDLDEWGQVEGLFKKPRNRDWRQRPMDCGDREYSEHRLGDV